MATQMESQVSQEPIVRHYRGASRADVEQAYRAEAAQAAQAGYLPMTHQWTTDWQGFLLAVTYRQSSGAGSAPQGAGPAVEPPQAMIATAQATAAARVPAQPAADQFAPSQPAAGQDPYAGFAPRDEVAPAVIATATVVASPVAPTAPAAPSEPAQQQWASVDDEAWAPVEQEEWNPPGDDAPLPHWSEQATPAADQVADSATTADEATEYEQPAPPAQFYEEPQAAVQEAPAYEAPEPAPYQPPEPVSYQPAEPAVYEPVAYQTAEPATYEAPVAPSPAPAAAPVYPQPAVQAAAPAPTPQRQAASLDRHATLTIQTMDLHTAGEPLRLIRSGYPDVPHLPVLERRKWVLQNADHVRRAIISEPRGHRDMYGAILLPPYSDYADMTVLFMHNEGYSTMCGHGIIAITTGLIEEGLYPATQPVTTIRYEVPAGIVAANAATVQLENGDWAVQGVRFTNVPSYLAAQSLAIKPEGVQLFGSAAQFGALSVDLAFGGAYYGIVNAAELGLRVVPEQADALRRAGAAITEVLRRDHTPAHPTDPALSFVYGTIIVDLDPRTSPDGRATRAHMRNATIFADAELDRSPCGSGTSAILAQLHARGRIKPGQEIINAGITGEHFLGRIEAETALGPYAAVSTSIAGTAYVTGFSTFVVDNRDPLGEGFLLS